MLAEQYLRYKAEPFEDRDVSSFSGVTQRNLKSLEKCFGLAIMVMSLDVDGVSSSTVWCSRKKLRKGTSTRRLYLNYYRGHFSLIKDIEGYARAYTCPQCDASFSKLFNLKRHRCDVDKASTLVFPGGTFQEPNTLFSELKKLVGIDVTDPELRFYPYRITYDIECFLPRNNLPEPTATLDYEARHEFLSVSVCSNVPNHTRPVCFVRRTTTRETVRKFVRYLLTIADEAAVLMRERFESVLSRVREHHDRAVLCEEAFADDNMSAKCHYASRKPLAGLLESLEKHLACVPVVGYNSQNYDINIIKGELLECIQEEEGEDFNFVVKRVNSMSCVQSRRLRLVDVCNYIAPGFTYAKYLRAFGCTVEKGFFPYEWMDDLTKLDCTELPGIHAFDSRLKGSKMDPADYEFCQRVWRQKRMRAFREFLIWYNNLDVEPFIEALEKQSVIYASKSIDMLKEAISLPGLAVRWLFRESSPPEVPKPTGTHGAMTVENRECLRKRFETSHQIHLVGGNNKDLHTLIKGLSWEGRPSSSTDITRKV
jgi:hypothetical protein